MNSKKIMKVVSVLLLLATIAMSVNMVFGVSIPSASSGAISPLQGPTTKILGIVQYICYAAAVILLIMLGIKFMTASPEGKAEIKKSAVIYVAGAALVFAAGLILTVILNTVSPVFQ